MRIQSSDITSKRGENSLYSCWYTDLADENEAKKQRGWEKKRWWFDGRL